MGQGGQPTGDPIPPRDTMLYINDVYCVQINAFEEKK